MRFVKEKITNYLMKVWYIFLIEKYFNSFILIGKY